MLPGKNYHNTNMNNYHNFCNNIYHNLDNHVRTMPIKNLLFLNIFTRFLPLTLLLQFLYLIRLEFLECWGIDAGGIIMA